MISKVLLLSIFNLLIAKSIEKLERELQTLTDQFEKELREIQGINKSKATQEHITLTASNEGLNKQLDQSRTASVKQKQTFDAQSKLTDAKVNNCLTEITTLTVNTRQSIKNYY